MIVLLAVVQAFAQRTVSGKVTDDIGEGLPGVNVVVKGTTTGVITDVDGNYRLSVSDGATLIFSYVGFESQEIRVGTQTEINVVLKSEIAELEDVVVTGYGDVSKRLYTGSAQSLDIEDVQVKGIGDVSQMLQGRAAGVNVQSVSGTFGAGPRITIRGSSSITGDGKPLWVIDGVIQEDLIDLSVNDLVSGNLNTLVGSSVAGLNPNDIESLEILRDGAATSLYGSRSLNGVIVIETKRGSKNQPLSVDYSAEFTVRDIPTYAESDILDSRQAFSVFRELENKGRLDITTIDQGRFSGVYGIMARRINTFDENTGNFLLANTPEARTAFLRQYEMANTNWFDVLFKRSLIQNHTISLSGGGESSRFYTSVGYYTDPGWTISDNVQRATVNFRNTGQSLMDIAVQEYGAVSQVFELVRANGLRGITDNVWAGDELVIPGSGPNRQRAAFMQAHQPIATIQDTDRAAGIGFWRIHFELKVS